MDLCYTGSLGEDNWRWEATRLKANAPSHDERRDVSNL